MKKIALVTSCGFGVRAREVSEQLFAHGYEVIAVNEKQYKPPKTKSICGILFR